MKRLTKSESILTFTKFLNDIWVGPKYSKMSFCTSPYAWTSDFDGWASPATLMKQLAQYWDLGGDFLQVGTNHTMD